MLKIAIIGCGKIADAHVEEIRKTGMGSVCAVCDRELLMAEQLASRYSVPRYYDDFEGLLTAERPDVVHITTPPQSHVALAQRAIDAGCHVYVEKPLAVRADSARSLLDHATQKRRKLTVGHEYNFDPPARSVQEMLKQGIIGNPVHIESYWGYDLGGSYGQAFLRDKQHWVHALPGGLFHNILDHVVNKLALFMPDSRPDVVALAYCGQSPMSGENSLDELRFILRSGPVSGYGTFSSHAKPVAHYLRVCGTKQTVLADFVSRTVVLERGPTLPTAIGKLFPPFGRALDYFREGSRNVARFAASDFQFFAGFKTLLSLFYTSIVEDTDPPIPYGRIVWVAAVMDEIFAQIGARQGATCEF